MKYPVFLNTLPFFGNTLLKTFLPHLKEPSLHQKVKRLLDKKDLVQLKKGLYMTSTYWQNYQLEPNFKVYIANILRYPSYVSGAYVLQRYDMLTEITYPITSVTLKSSRTYMNKIGTFIYYSITEDLYAGFTTEKYGEEKVYIASRVKALFDFFYFKYAKAKAFPKDLKESERIALGKLTSREKREFQSYCQRCHLLIFKKLPYLLFHE